ncbi:Uncharacterized protein TCM_042533 [Theobroma cacao]|uniref:Uncharacterized protein n=1 Tax=Theobroma cacao TaxID=3641 RepID=A0A061FT79_THECC|nr:Uncharacterized protein TCM_042533 [Theobroma cacao]
MAMGWIINYQASFGFDDDFKKERLPFVCIKTIIKRKYLSFIASNIMELVGQCGAHYDILFALKPLINTRFIILLFFPS